jgi:hypothetical protein
VERRPHIHAHDHEKDKTEYGGIEKIEKVKTGGRRGKKQKNTRTPCASGIQKDRESDPVHEALDYHGNVHEYHSPRVPSKLAIDHDPHGNRGHHGTKERQQTDRRNSPDIILNGQIYAEEG